MADYEIGSRKGAGMDLLLSCSSMPRDGSLILLYCYAPTMAPGTLAISSFFSHVLILSPGFLFPLLFPSSSPILLLLQISVFTTYRAGSLKKINEWVTVLWQVLVSTMVLDWTQRFSSFPRAGDRPVCGDSSISLEGTASALSRTCLPGPPTE